MFHDSFDNNQEEVLNAMYESFVRGVRNISPLNMNSTVALFKQLGRPEQAGEMIHRYVEVHSDKKEFFDIHNFRFGTDITDPDVMRAFDDKYASFEAERDQ
jgi:hypothetical protein